MPTLRFTDLSDFRLRSCEVCRAVVALDGYTDHLTWHTATDTDIPAEEPAPEEPAEEPAPEEPAEEPAPEEPAEEPAPVKSTRKS